MVRIYSRYDLPPQVKKDFDPKEGVTHQSFKDECDINNIVAKYIKTGTWGNSLQVATRVPMFGDFTTALDFRESMNRILDAQAEFDALPSKIRNRFHNEPQELLEFLNDVNNRDEAIKLGLIEKPAVNAGEPAAGAGSGAA